MLKTFMRERERERKSSGRVGSGWVPVWPGLCLVWSMFGLVSAWSGLCLVSSMFGPVSVWLGLWWVWSLFGLVRSGLVLV